MLETVLPGPVDTTGPVVTPEYGIGTLTSKRRDGTKMCVKPTMGMPS
jgi:hypothetical protein